MDHRRELVDKELAEARPACVEAQLLEQSGQDATRKVGRLPAKEPCDVVVDQVSACRRPHRLIEVIIDNQDEQGRQEDVVGANIVDEMCRARRHQEVIHQGRDATQGGSSAWESQRSFAKATSPVGIKRGQHATRADASQRRGQQGRAKKVPTR